MILSFYFIEIQAGNLSLNSYMKSENSLSFSVNFFKTKQVYCQLLEKHLVGFVENLQENIRSTLILPNQPVGFYIEK